MTQLQTNNIRITVCSEIDIDQSNAGDRLYLHSYTIHIENRKQTSVQLMRRKWIIKSQLGEVKVVKGEGVVGETPIIEPGASYMYSSHCVLQCDFGTMEGHFVFQDLAKKSPFIAKIPRFELENRWVLN